MNCLIHQIKHFVILIIELTFTGNVNESDNYKLSNEIHENNVHECTNQKTMNLRD